MRTFKEFLKESGTYGGRVISTDKNFIDLKTKETLNELNRSLLQVSGAGFVNPYNALEKVSKVLSSYGLYIPRMNILNEPSGQVVFEMQQFGGFTGQSLKYDNSVNGIQTSYQMTLPNQESPDPKYFLFFTYQMNENSVYNCISIILNQEEINAFVMA